MKGQARAVPRIDSRSHGHSGRGAGGGRPAAPEGGDDGDGARGGQPLSDAGYAQPRFPQPVAADDQRCAHPPGGGVAGHVDQGMDKVAGPLGAGEPAAVAPKESE